MPFRVSNKTLWINQIASLLECPAFLEVFMDVAALKWFHTYNKIVYLIEHFLQITIRDFNAF